MRGEYNLLTLQECQAQAPVIRTVRKMKSFGLYYSEVVINYE